VLAVVKRGSTKSKRMVGVDMSDWQPIDTAPVDCSEVLVWSDEYNMCLTVWIESDGGIFDARTGDALDFDAIWFWMPLPEPPEC